MAGFLRPDQIPLDGNTLEVVDGVIRVITPSSGGSVNNPLSDKFYLFQDMNIGGGDKEGTDNTEVIPGWATFRQPGIAPWPNSEIPSNSTGVHFLKVTGATSTTNRDFLAFRVSGDNYPNPFLSGPLSFAARLYYPSQSFGSHTQHYFGFMASLTGSEISSDLETPSGADYVAFVKLAGEPTWKIRTKNGGDTTDVDTGIFGAADTFYKFQIQLNEDFSEASFYAYGNLLATISTDIPSGGFTPFLAMRNETANSETVYMGVNWVEILAEGVDRGQNDSSPFTYTLDGVVTSSGGGFLSGAVVSIPALGISDTTNVNGEYSLSVPPGVYTVTATAANHLNFASTPAVSVLTNETYDFEMALPSNVTGTITSSATGQPVLSGLGVVIDSSPPALTNVSGQYSKLNLGRVGVVPITVADSAYYNSFSDTVDLNSLNVTRDFTLVPKTLGPLASTSGWEFASRYYAHLGRTFGNRFLAQRTVRCSSLGAYVGGTGTCVLRLWDSGGTLLRSAATIPIASPGVVVPVSASITPITLTAGQRYWVSCYIKGTVEATIYTSHIGSSDYSGVIETSHVGLSWENPTQVRTSSANVFPVEPAEYGSRLYSVEPLVQL